MAQIEDQYLFAIVYNKECALYGFNQHNLTNEQYYEVFNTKVDVGEDIGIISQQRVLMEYTAQETLKKSFMTSVQMKNCK